MRVSYVLVAALLAYFKLKIKNLVSSTIHQRQPTTNGKLNYKSRSSPSILAFSCDQNVLHIETCPTHRFELQAFRSESVAMVKKLA